MTQSSETRPYRFRNSLPIPFRVVFSGIYAILNRDNGKIYIGSAVKLNHRWTEHRCELEDGTHGNRYLQRAFKANPEAFYLELIEQIENATKEKLLSREQFWMDFYRSYLRENGYNIAPKAESCQGIKRSPEFLQKISAALKGRKFSPERCAAQRITHKGHKGRKMTDAEKEAARKRKLGKPNTKEANRKISEAHKMNPHQARAVHQFTLEGVYIKTFRTIKEAEMTFGRRVSIDNACNGRNRFAVGFLWRFADECKPTDVVKMRPSRRWPPKNGQ